MKNWILLFLKGMAMGASDVVPGVSGGTIAFITGIYERLIHAIKSINLANLKLFFTGRFREFWKNIDGWFLVCVVAGIGVSFLSLAKLITMLLNEYPQYVWSFFFGLILASTIFLSSSISPVSSSAICGLRASAVIAIYFGRSSICSIMFTKLEKSLVGRLSMQ